jgi:predicted amidohydrolase YtcJ
MNNSSCPRAPANLVFVNGKIVTVNPAFDIKSAIAISGERIAAVGSDAQALAAAGADATVIDLGGRTMTPGLIDGHAHMDREGLRDSLPSLAGARSIDDILARIEALVARVRPGEWIVTMPLGEPPGYEGLPGSLREGRFPNRYDLDRVAPDNPVYIRSIWGYWRLALPLVSIANSKALARAGIDRSTVAPVASVEIERDAAGEPTGVFIEHNKMPVVEHTLMRAAPSFDPATRLAALERSMQIYASAATTGVFEGHGVASEVIAAYQELNRTGRQTVRSVLAFSPAWSCIDRETVDGVVRSWAGWLGRNGLGNDWLRMQGLYAEVDDSPEALLRAADHPRTGWAGFHFDAGLPRGKIVTLLVEAARNDIQIIGIFPYMLDLFREANRHHPIAGLRWTLGHLSTLTDDDIAAIRDLGILVTTHTSSQIFKRGPEHLGRLPPERWREIVPLRRLDEAGVTVSLGSDNAPYTLFESIWHTVARKARTGAAVNPDQAVSRVDALRFATMGGAYQSFDEERRGSLEVGKLADCAVLSGDLLSCDEDQLPGLQSELTVVGGRIVFDRGNLPGRSKQRSHDQERRLGAGMQEPSVDVHSAHRRGLRDVPEGRHRPHRRHPQGPRARLIRP